MNIKNSVLFKNKDLSVFCIWRFIFGISYSFMIPIIPLFFRSIGLTTAMIGVVMSLYGVSKSLIQMPFGMVSDAIGDKRLLIIALVLMSLVPFAYTFANTQGIASSIYILQGAILGMAAPATFSILSRSLDPEKRGECTGFASAVFTLGGGIGAAVAGFIVAKLNNYNMVFYISSIAIFLTLLFVIFKMKKVEPTRNKAKQDNSEKRIKVIIQEIKKYKLQYKIILLGAIALLGDFIYGCIVSIFPFYGQEVLGASTLYTSTIISIYLFVFGVFAPLGGWTSDKIGVKKQLFISFCVMNTALLGLSFIRGIIFFTISIVVYFLGATFLNSALQNSLLEFGEDEKIKGIVFGFVGAAESAGYALGPLVSSYIYEINKSWLFIGLLIVSLAVTSIYLLLSRKAQLS